MSGLIARARSFWRERRHLVLRRDGRPVVDGAWGEWLLDLRTGAKTALVEITEAMAAKGAHLQVLGMGLDGHTASFFPDAENLPVLLDPRSAAVCPGI